MHFKRSILEGKTKQNAVTHVASQSINNFYFRIENIHLLWSSWIKDGITTWINVGDKRIEGKNETILVYQKDKRDYFQTNLTAKCVSIFQIKYAVVLY